MESKIVYMVMIGSTPTCIYDDEQSAAKRVKKINDEWGYQTSRIHPMVFYLNQYPNGTEGN